MKGYEALRQGAAWLDLSARGNIKVTGEDRARLLHAMTTNHIQQLTPGKGCYAFFLNDKGRILADANILCLGDHLLLDLEPETHQTVYQHLDHYIIADDAVLEDATSTLSTIAVEGPQSVQALKSIGAAIPDADYSIVAWGTRLIARLSSTGALGVFIFVDAAEKSALISELEAAGVLAADAEAARIVRIEHGKARFGEDLSERFLAQEANQPHAMNFSKGCYLGQEIVERVRSRGQVHRVLMPLFLETKQPPEPGAKLQIGETSVAEITSAAYSPALDKVAALAYVRTEHARPHTHMTLGEIEAEVA